MAFKILLLSLILVGFQIQSARSEDLRLGDYGADTIFVQPLKSPKVQPSVRAALTVEPVKYDTANGEVVLLPIEVMGAVSVGTGQLELTRAKASVLRWIFAYNIPVNVLTAYRDLDQGIQSGFDLIGVRVPVFWTKNGELTVRTGVELGVRHYSAPIDTTAATASFIADARTTAVLIENWLSSGIMSEIRYDLDVSKMSGLEEKTMGYLALLLDHDYKLYARVYSGLDFQPARKNVDLPITNFFTGMTIFGNFEKIAK